MTYQINSDQILLTQMGDEGVVYDTVNNKYLSLNETLFKILQEVEQGATPETIATRLSSAYKISEADCLAEVNNALKKLEATGYIVSQR